MNDTIKKYLNVVYYQDEKIFIGSSRDIRDIKMLAHVLKNQNIKYKTFKSRVYHCICKRHRCKIHVGTCYKEENAWLNTPYHMVKCDNMFHYEQGFHCELYTYFCSSYNNWELDYHVKQTQMAVALQPNINLSAKIQKFKAACTLFSKADEIRANHVAAPICYSLQDYGIDLDICLIIVSFIGEIKPLVQEKCKRPTTRGLIKYISQELHFPRPICFMIRYYLQ